MNIRLDHTAVRLAAGETFTVIDGKGARVAAVQGRVWLTQERDARDVLLKPGQGFELDRDGVTIVEALTDAEVALDEPPADAVPDAPRVSKLTALAVLGHARTARGAATIRRAA